MKRIVFSSKRLRNIAAACKSQVMRDCMEALASGQIGELDTKLSAKKYRIMCLRDTGWYVRYDGLESRKDATILVKHCLREGVNPNNVMVAEVIEK